MFVDELEILARGGRGGDGCVSFRREKYVPRGGPDGGDGGDGGAVVLRPTVHQNTLHHLAGQGTYEAPGGQPGRGSDRAGRDGGDLVLEVPVGTLVLDAVRGNVLADLVSAADDFVLARGGRGGRGNTRFATATNRTPRQAEEGRPGEERRVRLSLRLIADVGLVGLPNAGKSTLLATVTKARPRVADYPFTTLEPHLGIARAPDGSTLVLADIPGLIEGAHAGKGLGDRFLKHVERTRLLVQLVDCSAGAEDPEHACRIVRKELADYSPELARRRILLVASKVEDDGARQRAKLLADAMGEPVQAVSAVTRAGLHDLMVALGSLTRAARS